jgi:ketosteroid isomerase-like protein
VATEAPPEEPRALVADWVDAFNERDLERMLVRMSPEVRFHPLRLTGLDRSYRGHDGVRSWLRRLDELGHRHRIVLSELRGGSDGEVLGVGSLVLFREADPARFWLLHRVQGGVIVAAHHYLTDPAAFPGFGGAGPG